MEFIFRQRAAQGYAHFTFPDFRGLSIGEADFSHDIVHTF
jgi:hypothetical protein